MIQTMLGASTLVGLDLGSISVQRVVELDRWVFPIEVLYPTLPAEHWSEMRRRLDDRFIDPASGEMILSVHTYVVRVGGRTLLIDCCNGNHKPRPHMPTVNQLSTDYLGRLAAAGVAPEDVDVVMCTHLHTDHIGWNTRLADGRWAPTFPKAKYLFGRVDFEAMSHLRSIGPQHPIDADVIQAFEDSVLPVVDSGQVEFVEAGHAVERELDHGIWLEGAPGHTPGHVVVHLESSRGHAIATGDAFHHLFQLAWPQYPVASEDDPVGAQESRRRLFQRSLDDGAILLPGHIPAPTIGRVVEAGGRFGFAWADESEGITWT
jgi:glyoxylase-like metal-dependent hydrolase (beta-lactamase superfamily II)